MITPERKISILNNLTIIGEIFLPFVIFMLFADFYWKYYQVPISEGWIVAPFLICFLILGVFYASLENKKSQYQILANIFVPYLLMLISPSNLVNSLFFYSLLEVISFAFGFTIIFFSLLQFKENFLIILSFGTILLAWSLSLMYFSFFIFSKNEIIRQYWPILIVIYIFKVYPLIKRRALCVREYFSKYYKRAYR